MSTVYIYCMDCLRMEAEAPAVTLSAHVRLLSRTAVNSPTCIACSLYLQGGEKRPWAAQGKAAGSAEDGRGKAGLYHTQGKAGL